MKVALVLQRLLLAHNFIPLLCPTCQPESPEKPSIKSWQRIRACPIPSSFSLSAIQHIIVNHHALRACIFPLLSDTQLFCLFFCCLYQDNIAWTLSLEKPRLGGPMQALGGIFNVNTHHNKCTLWLSFGTVNFRYCSLFDHILKQVATEG